MPFGTEVVSIQKPSLVQVGRYVLCTFLWEMGQQILMKPFFIVLYVRFMVVGY